MFRSKPPLIQTLTHVSQTSDRTDSAPKTWFWRNLGQDFDRKFGAMFVLPVKNGDSHKNYRHVWRENVTKILETSRKWHVLEHRFVASDYQTWFKKTWYLKSDSLIIIIIIILIVTFAKHVRQPLIQSEHLYSRLKQCSRNGKKERFFVSHWTWFGQLIRLNR